jgi:large subunit ribosomal protein L10
VVDYAKQNEKLVLKGVYFDGQLFDKNMALELSKLPSKKELIGVVVGSIQGIISGFVGTLNSVITTFVGTIEAIEKKKKD